MYYLCSENKSGDQLYIYAKDRLSCDVAHMRRWLEAVHFGFRKKRNCTIYVAETLALISCAVTAQLICVFGFSYTKSRFSHDGAHIFTHFSLLRGYLPPVDCQKLRQVY